jgi:hypothetical protein
VDAVSQLNLGRRLWVVLLLAGCAPTIGGFVIREVPDGEPIILRGAEVRSRVSCARREVVIHRGDEVALWHEVDHVLQCCIRGVDCRQD